MASEFAAAAPSPDQDLERYVWDLSSLYPSQAAWEAERAYIQQKIDAIGQLKGAGKRNAKALADELDAISDLRSRATKMDISLSVPCR